MCVGRVAYCILRWRRWQYGFRCGAYVVVLPLVAAFAGDVGRQLVRAPLDLEVVALAGKGRHRLFQATLADEAPGSHSVTDDVNGDLLLCGLLALGHMVIVSITPFLLTPQS